MNICLVFSYNGIKFFGYQKQPKLRCVQTEIESILTNINNEIIRVHRLMYKIQDKDI